MWPMFKSKEIVVKLGVENKILWFMQQYHYCYCQCFVFIQQHKFEIISEVMWTDITILKIIPKSNTPKTPLKHTKKTQNTQTKYIKFKNNKHLIVNCCFCSCSIRRTSPKNSNTLK